MPTAAKDIEFTDVGIPKELEEELDGLIRSGWTMREVESGRDLELREIIKKHVAPGDAALVGILMTEIKYFYQRLGWEIQIMREKTALFKPKVRL